MTTATSPQLVKLTADIPELDLRERDVVQVEDNGLGLMARILTPRDAAEASGKYADRTGPHSAHARKVTTPIPELGMHEGDVLDAGIPLLGRWLSKKESAAVLTTYADRTRLLVRGQV